MSQDRLASHLDNDDSGAANNQTGTLISSHRRPQERDTMHSTQSTCTGPEQCNTSLHTAQDAGNLNITEMLTQLMKQMNDGQQQIKNDLMNELGNVNNQMKKMDDRNQQMDIKIDNQLEKVNSKLDEITILSEKLDNLELTTIKNFKWTENKIEQLEGIIENNEAKILGQITRDLTAWQDLMEDKLQFNKKEIMNNQEKMILRNKQEIREEVIQHFENHQKQIQTEMDGKLKNNTHHFDQLITKRCLDVHNTLSLGIEHNARRITEIEKITTENKTSWNKGNLPEIHVTCGGNTQNQINNDIHIPTFNGRNNNPMEYLNKIIKYINKATSRTQNNDKNYWIDIIEVSLQESASRWWQLIRDDIDNLEQFQTTFLHKYWSREIQNGIRYKMEKERYRPNGKLTRTEYFIEKILILRELTPKLQEEQMIDILNPHFDYQTQCARRVQNLNTITAFEEYLQRTDNDERNATINARNKRIEEQDRYYPNMQNYREHNSRQENHTRNYNNRPAYDNDKGYGPIRNQYFQRNNYNKRNEQERKPYNNSLYPSREQNNVCQLYAYQRNNDRDTRQDNQEQRYDTMRNHEDTRRQDQIWNKPEGTNSDARRSPTNIIKYIDHIT